MPLSFDDLIPQPAGGSAPSAAPGGPTPPIAYYDGGRGVSIQVGGSPDWKPPANLSGPPAPSGSMAGSSPGPSDDFPEASRLAPDALAPAPAAAGQPQGTPPAAAAPLSFDDLIPGGNGRAPGAGAPKAGSDSWLNTALHAALGFAAPMWEQSLPKDPRYEAIKSGAEDGLVLGGKNEIQAGIQALPSLMGGFGSYGNAYQDNLNKLQAQDQQLKDQFPIAYNAAGITTGLASGAVVPEAKLPMLGRFAANAGIGGVSGFLSTDGDLRQRALGAGIGAGIGGPLGVAAPYLLRSLPLPRTISPEVWNTVDQKLRTYGLTRSDLAPDAATALGVAVRRGAEPAQAATAAATQSLPVPIPLTRGQVTGLPEDQMAFTSAQRGARGPVAAARAQNFAAGQQGALRGNVQAMAENIAGGSPPMRGQGAIGVSDDLNAAYRAKKAGVNAAYDAARAHPAPALLPSHDAQAMTGGVRNALSDFDPLNVPRVSREVDRLAELSSGDINLKDLFASRSRLSQLRASPDAVEATAASRAVGAMDSSINDAITADLFHGDKASVQNWKDAIGARAEFGQLFDQGDLVDRLTQRTGSGGQRRLVVDPGDAANYILGRSDLGMIGKQNLYTDLSKVKSLVTPESWNALRSEVFQRIANQGEGGVENGSQQFSGAKFLKAWNNAKDRDARLVDTLFTPAEQRKMTLFGTISAQVTNPVKGGDNPSGTAMALRYLKKAGTGLLGAAEALPIVDAIPHAIENLVNRAATARALSSKPSIMPSPAFPLLPGRVGGAIGAKVAEPSH